MRLGNGSTDPAARVDLGAPAGMDKKPLDSGDRMVPKPVRELLDDLRTNWRVVQHPPLDTIDQGMELGIADLLGLSVENLSKSLLLEDAGGLPILLVAQGIRRPDLRQVRELVGCRRLHMAPAATLRQCLDTVPGRVSLLDLVDYRGQVDTVVLDGNLVATDQQTALPLGSDEVSVCLPGSCLPDLARKLVSQVLILPEN
ncbi:YbaK/EbsC family protein [Bifidobacterium sp. H1HS16N]|uniref:YbaK/EbsC family protein n=1 Tax=Bifidobacterium kimbladii TaxID=1293826 RepID=A0ABU3KDN3_9BIFI|nr:YbaK/EbsC family protein [Bifidobacterium sp. H1HS16N]MDT7508798.1 YbaK/EbsC family protein [Bifidobacterium sp. H1HS16N]